MNKTALSPLMATALITIGPSFAEAAEVDLSVESKPSISQGEPEDEPRKSAGWPFKSAAIVPSPVEINGASKKRSLENNSRGKGKGIGAQHRSFKVSGPIKQPSPGRGHR